MTPANLNPTSSTPSFSAFNPNVIPYQRKVIDDIYHRFDYDKGVHEILLSGSVGSAKSILMAHLAVRHCVENPKARCLLGRKSLPDLKSTIFQKILDHLEDDEYLEEGEHYEVTHNIGKIKFCNGSEIISRSWGDKKYLKFRSLELSMAVIEELTENDGDDWKAYTEISMRVGRLPHIQQNYIINATNPDSPSHPAYEHFISSNSELRHVYYSVTTDNPFLPKSYIEKLQTELDPKMARRMIHGEWIEIAQEVVYYAYSKDRNYLDESYEVNVKFPIFLSWDFNIGEGKPMSVVCFQFIDDHMHIFDEVVVEGMRTEDSCEELEGRGLLNYQTKFYLTGDAAGKHRDTRNKRSDYDIIERFFGKIPGMNAEKFVFPSNTAIRKRHNLVNSYCMNDLGQVRLTVYKNAKMADKGLRLTQLKKGGNYIEDDGPNHKHQHISTAIGYGLRAAKVLTEGRKTKQVQF